MSEYPPPLRHLSRDCPVKQAVWDKFCARFHVLDACVPLFAVGQDGSVQQRFRGNPPRPYLMRSEECEAMILSVTDALRDDHESDGVNRYDGMLYMMGWIVADRFVPLYIGKTETLGRNGTFSANIAGLHTNKSKFARWGTATPITLAI